MFQVFDNHKLCDYRFHNVHHSWVHPLCESFEDAQKYAKKWLGIYSGMVPNEVDESIDYTGYGDSIIIKEIKEGCICKK